MEKLEKPKFGNKSIFSTRAKEFFEGRLIKSLNSNGNPLLKVITTGSLFSSRLSKSVGTAMFIYYEPIFISYVVSVYSWIDVQLGFVCFAGWCPMSSSSLFVCSLSLSLLSWQWGTQGPPAIRPIHKLSLGMLTTFTKVQYLARHHRCSSSHNSLSRIFFITHTPHPIFSQKPIKGDPSKTTWRIFSLRRGLPPHSAMFFLDTMILT